MHSISFARRLFAGLLGLVAMHAQAQVLGQIKWPPFEPILWPTYYEARVLGRVATSNAYSGGMVPVGCMSRGGVIAINGHQDPARRSVTTAYMVDGNQLSELRRVVGAASYVMACNSQREYTGFASGLGSVVWDSQWGNTVQQLPSDLGGPLQPFAINEGRTVVGRWYDSLSIGRAAVVTTSSVALDPTHTRHSLFPGHLSAINNAGYAVGTYHLDASAAQAVLITPGLTGFALPLPGAVWSDAGAVDELLRVAGSTKDGAGTQRGYLWHYSEGFASLLPARHGDGATLAHSVARAIGPGRFVAGQSFDRDSLGTRRPIATVWPLAGAARNLNYETAMTDGTALPNLTNAIAVSDSGAILSEGYNASGQRVAVLLTPRVGGRWALMRL